MNKRLQQERLHLVRTNITKIIMMIELTLITIITCALRLRFQVLVTLPALLSVETEQEIVSSNREEMGSLLKWE